MANRLEESSFSGQVSVAFQGERGAYSEQAALKLLGGKQFGGEKLLKTVGYSSFERCFEALEQDETRFALLPIENSLGGTIHANYDLQLRYGFSIVAEYELLVRHCLVVLPGVSRHEIKKIFSHPQALAQCDRYIRKNGFIGEVAYDTAGSAKILADSLNRGEPMRDYAAIASSLAAEHYGLEIMEEGIEDDANNFTRFILLSKKWLPLPSPNSPVKWKTTLVFSLVDHTGVLVKALTAFSSRDVNLTKLESRPDALRLRGRELFVKSQLQGIPESDRELVEKLNLTDTVADEKSRLDYRFQEIFYVDFVSTLANVNVRNSLRHLSELATFMRILGSYPANGHLCGYVVDCVTTATKLPDLSLGHLDQRLDKLTSFKLKIGILGFGNFGQFMAKMFARNHEVFASSRTDYRKEASALGVNFCCSVQEMFEQAQGLDVLVISVSILSFENVVRKLPLDLLNGVLVVDVLSVKTLPKTLFQILLPKSADILCTHPMFGPESGKYSWNGLPCVYEKVRVSSNTSNTRCEAFLDIFRREGCRMVELSGEMHDEAAAGSQFVTHLTGRVLDQLNLASTPINTKGFDTLLDLVDNTCKDSFDLFLALYKCNPNASSQLSAMQNAMVSISRQLSGSDLAPADFDTAVKFSDIVNRIQPSKTGMVHAKALELKRQGKDILSTLTVGEPDFLPPKPILDAVERSVKLGLMRYTSTGGMHDLKVAISHDYSRRKNVEYDPSTDILVTHGGKQAIFMCMLSLCQAGDEVVIPSPYWTSYPEIVLMSGARPVFIERSPENGYIMTPAQLEKALSSNTRIVILCNPCNPTGACYSRSELEALMDVLRKPQFAHIWVMADEIYERLIYDELEHVSIASLRGMKGRTLLVNGFSKGYAMTGFRLGWFACGNKSIVASCLKLQSQLNSCASSISQYAGIAALVEVPDETIAGFCTELEAKRNKMVSALQSIPNVICAIPRGAFYAFADISFYLGKGLSSKSSGKAINTNSEFCDYLLSEFGLAVPPGEGFGSSSGIRFSYAASISDIENGAKRFRLALENLI